MVVTALAVLALGGHVLLVTSVLRRLASPVSFLDTLTGHRLLPARLRRPAVAAALEAGQLLVGLAGVTALVGGRDLAAYWVLSCAAAAVLYAGFAVYLTVLLRVRGRVSCGCFGQRDRVGAPSIARAAGFAAATGLAALLGIGGPPDLVLPARLLVLAAAALVAGFSVHIVALAAAVAESRPPARS